jgi:outer membrane immunogenic protein
MKIKSSIVVATAAGSALAPNAYAADMPVKAPKVSAFHAWNWTGFHVGVHLGAAWQNADTAATYLDGTTAVPIRHTANTTGFVGGGQIGYNWQSGMIVYGLEADVSALSSSSTVTSTQDSNNFIFTSRQEIEWLATIRGRLGAVLNGNTLIYVTGGWAFADVKNDHSEVDVGNATTATWTDHSTRSGYAVGGGIEHMINPAWTVRVEGLYVDLGDETISNNTGTCDTACQPVTFSNDLLMVRGAVNYKFAPM